MADIAVWRAADGSWAWGYRAPGERDVVANRTFESREAAVASARRAYPGVPVRERRVRSARIPRSAVIAAAVAAAIVLARRGRGEVRVRPLRGFRPGA